MTDSWNINESELLEVFEIQRGEAYAEEGEGGARGPARQRIRLPHGFGVGSDQRVGARDGEVCLWDVAV